MRPGNVPSARDSLWHCDHSFLFPQLTLLVKKLKIKWKKKLKSAKKKGSLFVDKPIGCNSVPHTHRYGKAIFTISFAKLSLLARLDNRRSAQPPAEGVVLWSHKRTMMWREGSEEGHYFTNSGGNCELGYCYPARPSVAQTHIQELYERAMPERVSATCGSHAATLVPARARGSPPERLGGGFVSSPVSFPFRASALGPARRFSRRVLSLLGSRVLVSILHDQDDASGPAGATYDRLSRRSRASLGLN